MPLSKKMGHQFIDPVLHPLFEVLYSLPEEDAQAAFSALSQLSVMSPSETLYPSLPDLFQKEIYQTKDIQDALRQLSEIMYNRQPQESTPHAEGHTSANWGKFGLIYTHVTEEIKTINGEEQVILSYEQKSRDGAVIAAEDIHDYMRYKFFVAKLNVVALRETKEFINQLKRDPALKKEYELFFAKWISVSEDQMPEAMRHFLLSSGALKQKIAEALIEYPGQSDYKTFMPDLDGLIDELFLMSPALFDSEMSEALDFLSQGYFIKEEKQVTWKVLSTPEYKTVREKLKAQAEEPDEYYSFDVISSFLKVAELQEKLNIVGSLMKEHHPALARECERICRETLQHLERSTQDQQVSLSENDFLIVSESITRIDELKEINLFVRDFFSNYFASDYAGQAELIIQLFKLVFEKKAVHIDDGWKERLSRANPEEKGVLTITTEHRNQVFLHAITLPVEKWTPAFYQTFNEILTLLETSSDPAVIAQKEYSYPLELMKQLRWLCDLYLAALDFDKIRHYLTVLNFNEIRPSQPRGKLFLLYYSSGFTHAIDYLPSIIRSLDMAALHEIHWLYLIDNIAKLFRFNHEADRFGIILNSIKNRLPDFVTDEINFNRIYRHLDDEGKANFFEKLLSEKKFREFIKTSDSFCVVLQHLNPAQKIALINAVDLSVILKDKDKIYGIWDYLEQELKPVFFERAESILMRFPIDPFLFEKFCGVMSPEKRDTFFDDQMSRLIIRTGSDLGAVCHYLKPEQITVLCETLNKWCNFFNNVQETGLLKAAFLKLDHAQKAVIFNYIQHRLDQIISCKDDVDFLIHEFPEKKEVICSVLKSKWPKLIEDRDDLLKYMKVFDEVKPDQTPVLLEALRFELPQIIPSETTLRSFFDDRQKTAILDWLLIGILDKKIKERGADSDYSRFNVFAYSAVDKMKAALMLKNAILHGHFIEQKHVNALLNGSLGRELNHYFTNWRPFQEGETLKGFLESKMKPSGSAHQPR